jgi:hypothetical protein
VIGISVELFGIGCLKNSYLESVQSGRKGSHIGWLKAINLLRFLQFMAFNLVVVDGAFYGSRILVHTKKYGMKISEFTFGEMLSLFTCLLFFQLLLIDMVRLFRSGQILGSAGSPFHQDYI